VIAEMQILKKLGFNVHVQLPYAIMVNYLKVLELTEHPTIPQRAWGFMNDGYVLFVGLLSALNKPMTAMTALSKLWCCELTAKLELYVGFTRLRTSIYICYQPPTIACSVIWLAAREAGVPLPTSPAWWEVLDADLEDIENIAGHIKSLYYKKLPISDLPLTIEETEAYLTKQQQIILAMMDVEKRTSAVGHDTTAAQNTGQNAISTAAQTGGKRASRFS